MKFHEHIIQVTVPGLPVEVERADLVAGIADYARHPERYLEEMSGSRLTSGERPGCSPDSVAFSREVRFGDRLVFVEEVEVGADGSYRSHVPADGPRPALDFSMQIEEPEPGSLFIRFIYFEDREAPAKESVRDQQISHLRRLAYESKDRSLVTQILTDLAERKQASQN